MESPNQLVIHGVSPGLLLPLTAPADTSASAAESVGAPSCSETARSTAVRHRFTTIQRAGIERGNFLREERESDYLDVRQSCIREASHAAR